VGAVKTRRVVVIFPPARDLEPIAPLRRRFDPLAALVPPHITLVFPFESELSTPQVRAHVEQAIGGIGSFPLRLGGITGSEARYLLLNVKRGNDAIIELHDRLYTGPLGDHLSLKHTYVPHLTVGRLPTAQAFEAALAAATAMDVGIETVASAVSVYRVEADSTRPLELEVPLA
jgi:2'-5' RNA ligase